MVNSAMYRERQKAEQEDRRNREAKLQAQKEAELKLRECEKTISRILGSTRGYSDWARGMRNLANRDEIGAVFSKRGIPVPTTDPTTALSSDLLRELCRDLECAGFLVSLNPVVTVRACAALYWDIELGN